MSTVTGEVVAICRPETGKKRGKITLRDGSSIGCFAERMGQFKIGATYAIEVNEVTVNGMALRNVGSAKLLSDARPPAAKPAPPAATAPPPQATMPAGNTYRQTDPVDAERMFCAGALFALIKAGECNNNDQDLFDTTRRLRRVWRGTFGSEGAYLPKKDARPLAAQLEQEMHACQSPADLDDWHLHAGERIDLLPLDWQHILTLKIREHMAHLYASGPRQVWSEAAE